MKTITPITESVLMRLDGLSVTYPGGHEALRGISLKIRRGEVLVLLGRSGAGKSTLLRCINLLQVPTAGEVWFQGFGKLKGKGPIKEHRRRTGMIFQLHHLIGRQTALQNVLMGRLAYHSTFRSLFPLPRPDVELAMECLDRVGMTQKAMKRVDRLSGGERQRVGIARALAQQPRILLADEPVASLDPATAESVLNLLCRISKEDGLTVILSLHQIEFACRFGERIVGLADGEIVFDGTPRDLTDSPLEEIYRKAAPCEPPKGTSMEKHPDLEKRSVQYENKRSDLHLHSSSM
jgi:phosphonate transport system ATP-binding protein